MGPLGELGALFNPGMRHEIEERESKANRREEEGNARDGDLRIDLASGVAVINLLGRSAGDAAKPEQAATAPSADAGDLDGVPAAPATNKAPATRRSNSGSAVRAARSDGARVNSAAKSGAQKRGEHPVAAKAAETPRPASKASRAAR